jgi:hypothetical protein
LRSGAGPYDSRPRQNLGLCGRNAELSRSPTTKPTIVKQRYEEREAKDAIEIRRIKSVDEKYWQDHFAKILGCANSSSSAAKRMFSELRSIRARKVPFVSAVSLDDGLGKVLASIEDSPETPYEGGVFWITVKLLETDPLVLH